jgi:hypothetical protein
VSSVTDPRISAFLSAGTRTGKLAYTAADGRPLVAPVWFIVEDGIAELSEEPAELLRTATAIAARYMGEDQAEEFGKRNAVPGELVVRLRPTKVITVFDMVA